MIHDELYNALNYVTHARDNRSKYANMVKNNMDLFPVLLQILFKVDNKISCRAAWIMEFICSDNIETITPYLDYFTENISQVHLDMAVRPVAKVCASISQTYNAKQDSTIKVSLKQKHKELLIETGFDWLIGSQKVAVKAHAMETLFLLGKEQDFLWVHPELIQILEQDFSKESAAYKARAKSIFKRIKTNK
ncbi:MAG: adenylosuccinate lyase [Aestuariibaculum sp.]